MIKIPLLELHLKEIYSSLELELNSWTFDDNSATNSVRKIDIWCANRYYGNYIIVGSIKWSLANGDGQLNWIQKLYYKYVFKKLLKKIDEVSNTIREEQIGQYVLDKLSKDTVSNPETDFALTHSVLNHGFIHSKKFKIRK